MKNRSGEKIKLTSIDEFLGVVNEESAMGIEIDKIKSFAGHPFKVIDDEKMQNLIESISESGVLTPVLIPVQAAYLPVKGLQQLIKTISMVKKRLNRKLQIMGILLTMVDFRTNYAKDISTMLHVTYGSKITIFENVIPLSVKAAETSAEGISIYAHCPKSKVSNAYKNLTQEVLENEK